MALVMHSSTLKNSRCGKKYEDREKNKKGRGKEEEETRAPSEASDVGTVARDETMR
jgi:hypothetical protein